MVPKRYIFKLFFLIGHRQSFLLIHYNPTTDSFADFCTSNLQK